MKIALFGGSFDPPHRGHAWIVEHLLALADKNGKPLFDEVWLLPTPLHAFGKKLRPFDDRKKMCALLLADCRGDITRAHVDDIETRLPEPARTMDTLQALRERLPKAQFTLIMGSDLKSEVEQWKDFSGIKKAADLYWVPRHGFADTQAGEIVEAPPFSSTEIRQALQRNKTGLLKMFLTPKVRRYLTKKRLYF